MKNRGRKLISTIVAACMTLSLLPVAALAAVYEGEMGETGEVKKSVRVTLQYQYSPTGGMAGISAHSPETVEFFVNENEDGTVTTTPEAWPIPYYNNEGGNEYHDHDHYNLQGFRVVLNAAPLDEFMVNPPTGNETPEELEEALNRGDFNVRDGVSEEELETAWIAGRTFEDEDTGLIFQVVDKGGHESHGSSALEGPQLVLQNPEALTGNKEVTVTVTYRRDNGEYTVRHLVPKSELSQDVNDPDDWVEESTENKQGRIGAMTNAEAKFVYGYMHLAIAQQPIEVDGQTVIDVFYVKDDTLRVVFDTSGCNGEIDRQMPRLGETVDLSPAAAPPPTRDGYGFAGWSYRGKNDDGSRGELLPVTGAAEYDSASETLTLNEDFLNRAYFQPSQETAGVNVLRLYPIWEPGATQVRVVFWTEDLTGKDDVDSREKDAPGDLTVISHHYSEDDVEYSNAGSVALTDVLTGCALDVDIETGALTYTDPEGAPVSLNLREELAKLPTMEIATSFQTDKGFPEAGPTWDAEDETKCALNDSSKFYTLDAVDIHQRVEAGKEANEESQAAAEGTTVVNVYYIRNVYQLEFHYVNTERGYTEVATHTRGYANRKIGHEGAANTFRRVNEEDESLIPETVVLTAKYGADLRDVWPYRGDLTVRLDLEGTPEGGKRAEAQFVSWTTTKGPYNAEARRRGLGSSDSEPTIMGTYGAMSADIIADPDRHIGVDGYDEADAHHLYAYWSDWQQNSYYHYNHCYEVPGVTQEMLEKVGEQVVLDGESEDDVRNVFYLIPADSDNGGEVIDFLEGYRFNDLQKVCFDQDKGAGGVETHEDGDYYAFRVYGDKCYALSRQVDVTSSNNIKAQNPSARSHMTRMNDVPDHSTKYNDTSGGYSGDAIGTEDDSVQLFFYYDRIPYTIEYSVGAYDLGQKTIYCGAQLSRAYNIQLESGVSADGVEEDARTNGEYALGAENPNGWDLPETGTGADGTQSVCPDRNAKGTKAWTFRGWALDQAGTALLEDKDVDWDGVVSGSIRLYAQWEVPTYTVEFDWNGGGLAFGTDAEYKIQEISANGSVRRGGLVPTLVRSGYSQDSWEITGYELGGQWYTLKPSEYQPFQIDGAITANLRVRANWKEIEGANVYTYTVRHVLESDPAEEIAEAQKVTGSFVPGSLVWGNPVKLKGEYAGYIPTRQNGSAQVPMTGKDIVPIEITYRPPTADGAYTYKVDFADWSTQELVHSVTVPATESAKTVYAAAYLHALDEKGYWLVDEQGEHISGLSDALLVTLPREGSNTARFLVGQQVYEIGYDTPQGMTAESWAEIEETLPKSYTPAEGAVELPVPGTNGTYEQDGRTYGFAGWKLTRGNLRGEPDSTGAVFETVTIDPESRGALTFQARWEENYRGIDFLPGDHGAFADGKTMVSFSALEETPLGEQEAFAIPEVTAAQGYVFKGWKDAAGKVYTAQDLETLVPAVGRTVFTAQYERKTTPGGNTPGETVGGDPGDVTGWLEREKHEAYIFGRDGGLVAPEAEITRAEVVTIFYRLLTAEKRAAFKTRENPFADVDGGDWFFEAAAAMAKAGIVEGRPGGSFAPWENITRGEFAAIAARFLSETKAPPADFPDISGHWAEKYIDRATQAGWIKGYPDGSFRPDALITRAEAITLVNAVLGRAPHKDGLDRDMVTWPDNMDTAKWYYLAVQEATNSHEYTWQTVNSERVEKWTKVAR